MNIKNVLRNFTEENKSEMSVNVYNGIWNIIQSIEHEEVKMSIGKCDRCGLTGDFKKKGDYFYCDGCLDEVMRGN